MTLEMTPKQVADKLVEMGVVKRPELSKEKLREIKARKDALDFQRDINKIEKEMGLC